jgi:hypothetical protein
MSVDERALSNSLSPPAIGVPAAHADARAARRTALGLRGWLLTAFLFTVPLVAYWPATFHEYGLRDDYSNLRESHEEIGKVVQFCASHARPIYGWLLQATYGQTSSVHNLEWMRLLASLILGAISLVLLRGLRALGWSFGAALSVALLVPLVPAAQVIAGWAVGWPYAATALLSLGVFFTAETALSMAPTASSGRLLIQWVVALGLMVVSALIYQPSTLFYVVPLAGALIARRERGLKETARWLGAHVSFILASLALAYCTMTVLYSMGVFVKSGRIAFEHHWGDKTAWFLTEALPNALSLFALNDNNDRGHLLYLGCAAAVGLVLLAGAWVEWRRHGRERGIIWLAGLCGLPVLAFLVNLIASEHYATYRTVLAMTAVLVCFLVASVRSLTESWNPGNVRLAAATVLCAAFFLAQHHAYALLAVPQGNEWQLILQGAKQVRLSPHAKPSIFAIASSPADISTESIYHDEFGSLSSNSEWVPKEMFERAMHDLHPDIPDIDSRYEFSEGYKLPAGYKLPPDRHFDVVIDMRRLRGFRTDN